MENDSLLHMKYKRAWSSNLFYPVERWRIHMERLLLGRSAAARSCSSAGRHILEDCVETCLLEPYGAAFELESFCSKAGSSLVCPWICSLK